jgi:hypothetical protein
MHKCSSVHTTVPINPDIFSLPCCTSSVSFFSCCDGVAALALVNYNEHVTDANISRPHPPTPSVLCTVPKARKAGLAKPLIFPFGIYARVPSAFSVSRAKLLNGVSGVSPLFPALFLPRALRLQAAFSPEIAHMQAGQCGHHQ